MDETASAVGTAAVAELIQQYARPDQEGLYTALTRRLRACGTMFGDRIKLVLTQEPDEQYAALLKPYLIIIPIQSRPQLLRPEDDQDAILIPHHVALIAQFDGGSSALATGGSWAAADQVDAAERQLLFALINWRPNKFYAPTVYASMRVVGTNLPNVKVQYMFVFQQWYLAPETCCDEPECTELGNVYINVISGCGEPEPECGPCQ